MYKYLSIDCRLRRGASTVNRCWQGLDNSLQSPQDACLENISTYPPKIFSKYPQKYFNAVNRCWQGSVSTRCVSWNYHTDKWKLITLISYACFCLDGLSTYSFWTHCLPFKYSDARHVVEIVWQNCFACGFLAFLIWSTVSCCLGGCRVQLWSLVTPCWLLFFSDSCFDDLSICARWQISEWQIQRREICYVTSRISSDMHEPAFYSPSFDWTGFQHGFPISRSQVSEERLKASFRELGQ